MRGRGQNQASTEQSGKEGYDFQKGSVPCICKLLTLQTYANFNVWHTARLVVLDHKSHVFYLRTRLLQGLSDRTLIMRIAPSSYLSPAVLIIRTATPQLFHPATCSHFYSKNLDWRFGELKRSRDNGSPHPEDTLDDLIGVHVHLSGGVVEADTGDDKAIC